MSKNRSILYMLSDSEFISLFRSCNSYSAILRSLGLSTNGSASRTVLFARMRELSLTRDDLSKDKQSHVSHNVLSDSDIFVDGSYVSGHALKSHYLNIRTKSYECDVCGISQWNNMPIVLHLDHINGVKTDNRFQNLRLLCPNCDSQMNTYRGRNIRINGDRVRNVSHRYNHSGLKTCCICNTPISDKATYCRACSNRIKNVGFRHFVVDREELKSLIKTMSFTAIGKKYGVSDNAVRKRCKFFGLPFKSCDIKKYSDEEWTNL